MTITDFKFCTGCKQHKHRDEFAKNWQTKDGLNGWCRVCFREYRKRKKAAA